MPVARGQAGFEGRAFLGSRGNGASASSELVYLQDVTINASGDEIETTSRDDAPWKNFVYGLQEWSADLNLLYRNDDSSADLLENAFYAQTILSIRFIDADGEGFYGDIIVNGFPKEEPLGDAMVRTVPVRGLGAPTRISTVS